MYREWLVRRMSDGSLHTAWSDGDNILIDGTYYYAPDNLCENYSTNGYTFLKLLRIVE